MSLYLSDPWGESGYFFPWISFESDPGFPKTTAANEPCTKCLLTLYKELKEEKGYVNLPDETMDCWKVVAVLDDIKECGRFLDVYDHKFDRYVIGKLGGGRKDQTSKVVIMNTSSESERDELEEEFKTVVGEVNPNAPVFYKHGCENYHGAVIGDWDVWNNPNPIKNPENVDTVISAIETLFNYRGK